MISRELANCLQIHAFEGESTAEALMPFHSCGEQAGFSCSGYGVLSTAAIQSDGLTSGQYGARGGRIIDRLALKQNFNSVALLCDAWGMILASATCGREKYQGVALGLQDSSSTCSADFAAYSTANWLGRRPLTTYLNATTTLGAFYSSCGEADLISPYQSGILTTGNTTACGYTVLINSPIPVFPLTGAKRYLRMLVAPTHFAEGTNTVMPMHVVGSLLFADPDKGPPDCTPQRGRAIVTSGTST